MSDIVKNLAAYLDNQNPSVDEARTVFEPLTRGEYTPVQIAALLVALRTRGERFADITGAAQAFIAAAREFPVPGKGILDTAGTGGDGANTINISTAASLVASAGGCRLVKCGNRSVSSKSGSADVLESLGIPLDLDTSQAVKQFDDTGFTFLFAPAYHPAVAHVQPVRRELKIPTIFNILGPLLSPVRPEFQLMGIANPTIGQMIAEVLRELGRSRALVVHGSGTDEIAVHGETLIWELSDGEITHYTVTPADLGVSQHALSDLAGGDAAENAAALRAVFAGTAPVAHRDAIAVNAGAMFYLNGTADSLAAGTEMALQLLADGAVQEWLVRQDGTDYRA